MCVLQDIKPQSVAYVITANFMMEWKLIYVHDPNGNELFSLKPQMAVQVFLLLNFAVNG